jgi:tetratricopeptide (TPR) repeat protein
LTDSPNKSFRNGEPLLVYVLIVFALGFSVVAFLKTQYSGTATGSKSGDIATEAESGVRSESATVPTAPVTTRLSQIEVDVSPWASEDSTVIFRDIPLSPKDAALESEAFRVAEDLLRALPNSPQALHVAAVCNSQLHKTQEAQNLWLKCIELSPKSETYYLNVAANAMFRGETELALETLRKAKAIGLDSNDISHHMGMALGRLGEDEQAVQILRPAVSKDPNLAGHWLLLGQSEFKLGKLDEARLSSEKAVDLGVRTRSVYQTLLNIAARQRDKEQVAKYKTLIDALGDQPAEDGQQQYRNTSLLEAKRTLIAVLAEASAVYRDAQRFQDAEHVALRLLALEPNNYGMLQFLAELYAKQKMLAEELTVRSRMQELRPQDMRGLLVIAKVQSELKRPKQCEATLKTLISIAPEQAIGYAAMAEFLLSIREAPKAQWYAEQALKHEASPGGYRLLSTVLRAQGKDREAQELERNSK